MAEKTMTTAEGVTSLLASMTAEAPKEKPQDEAPPQTSEEEAPETDEEEVEDPAPEDDEADPDDESASEDDETDADEAPREKTIRVKLDDEERDVPLKDLVLGYQRGQNYEQKAARAREAQEKADAILAEATQARDRYSQQLSTLEGLLSQEDPDLQKLKEADPTRYLIATRDRDEALKRIQAEQARVVEEQRKHEHQRYLKWAQAEGAKVPSLIPAWRDESRAKSEAPKVAAFARQMGFTDEEIRRGLGARELRVLRDAWLHNEGRKVKDKKVPQRTAKPVTAGKPQTKAESTGRAERDAFQRLKREGTAEAGVAALLARSKKRG